MTEITLTPNVETEQARHFKLDPDEWVEITCPDCYERVVITGGNVFHAGAEVGEPLNGDATLGDLIDAANKHVCADDNGDA